MNRLASDGQFDPTLRQIFDFSRVTKVGFGGPQIEQFAKRRIFGPDSLRVFVVSSPLHFGFARMYSIYRELQGDTNIQVFNHMSEAIEALGVPTDVALNAFTALYQLLGV